MTERRRMIVANGTGLSTEEKEALKTFLVTALKGDLVIVKTPEVP